MSGVTDYINQGKNTFVGFADDLSNALDFGSNAPPRDTVKPQNPEQDISTIDRSNPTNLHFSALGAIPAGVWYAGAALIGYFIYRKIK